MLINLLLFFQNLFKIIKIAPSSSDAVTEFGKCIAMGTCKAILSIYPNNWIVL